MQTTAEAAHGIKRKIFYISLIQSFGIYFPEL